MCPSVRCLLFGVDFSKSDRFFQAQFTSFLLNAAFHRHYDTEKFHLFTLWKYLKLEKKIGIWLNIVYHLYPQKNGSWKVTHVLNLFFKKNLHFKKWLYRDFPCRILRNQPKNNDQEKTNSFDSILPYWLTCSGVTNTDIIISDVQHLSFFMWWLLGWPKKPGNPAAGKFSVKEIVPGFLKSMSGFLCCSK